MRIIIDMQGAQSESRFRGIGRYTRACALAMVRNRGEHQVLLLLNGLFPDSVASLRQLFLGLLPQENILVWHAPGPVRELGNDLGWRREVAEVMRESFIAELNPDFVYVLSLFEGYVDDAVTSIGSVRHVAPTIVTLYDLIPLARKDVFLDPNPHYSNHYYRKLSSLGKARYLVAISEFSVKEASQLLGAEPDVIRNVSAACDAVFTANTASIAAETATLSSLGIAVPFILYCGGGDERKNVKSLVRAYAKLPTPLRERYLFVIGGKLQDGDRESIRSEALQLELGSKHLLFTGEVSDEALACLYRNCELFVFPSLHEGFGLTVLEAMSCGAVVIGSNRSSVPEVLGNEDASFDPLSDASISGKLLQALTDEVFRRNLLRSASEQVKRFSWDITAKRVWDVIESNPDSRSAATGRLTKVARRSYFAELLVDDIAEILSRVDVVSNEALLSTATAFSANVGELEKFDRNDLLPEQIIWRLEGPFDSSYSLALLNRETGRALNTLGHCVLMHSTEGPGDFAPNDRFLRENADIAALHKQSERFDRSLVHVTSRNLYPPRVHDMRSPLNLLHHYAWEESGFPCEWVDQFNSHLHGITCLSNHVKKVMIDNGVAVPLFVSGCGVDHWDRVEADRRHSLSAKSFRFIHVSSCFPRKGADLLLQAYGQAFSSEEDVSLVIKTFSNPHNDIHRWLADARDRFPNFPHVVVIEDDLSDGQLKWLYEQCHVLVAPSRAEGFGLPMAEAMLSGLGVVTTNWGGQTDFCNEETAWLIDYVFEPAVTHFELFDSVWAAPKVDGIASAMKSAFLSPKFEREKRSASGRALLASRFKWTDAASRLVAAARELALSKVRPQLCIGWVTTWHARCGIAAYSAYMTCNLSSAVTVFAPVTAERTMQDDERVRRVWEIGEHESLQKLADGIRDSGVNVLVIQFNFGFFNLQNFAHFVTEQVSCGIKIVLVMHSTTDPVHVPGKKLAQIRDALAICHRVVVHSTADLNTLKTLNLVDNVMLFPLGLPDISKRPTDRITQSQTSAVKPFTIGSYGYFLPHKGLLELVEVVKLLRDGGLCVQLKMINAEYPAAESAAVISQARALVRELELDEVVEIVTEYLPDHRCIELLGECDLLVFPYQFSGESASAAVRFGIASGIDVAVTPISIFRDVEAAVFELPGVTPIEMANGVRDYIKQLELATTEFSAKRLRAKQWRDAHRYSKLGTRFLGFLTALRQDVDSEVAQLVKTTNL